MSKKIIIIISVMLFALITMGAAVFFILGGFKKVSNKNQTKENTSQKTSETEKAEKWTKNPAVVFGNTTSTCTVNLDDGTFRMYLMSEGGIYYTDSVDGKTFGAKVATGITQSQNMMISNPSVLKISDGDWIMVYEEAPQKKPSEKQEVMSSVKTQRNLYLATSADGKSFKKAGLAIDSSKEDNFFASVPELVKISENKIRMYYVSGGEAIGSAVSEDRGKTWKREPGYRLTDMAVDPEVIYENGVWTMYFATLPKPEIKNRNAIYKAISADGLNWEGKTKVLEPKSEEGFMVDPDIIKIGDTYRMFFGEAEGGLGATANTINLFAADKE